MVTEAGKTHSQLSAELIACSLATMPIANGVVQLRMLLMKL